ncbi:MAG TPA: hypothetical protein VF485_01110 [Sphingomonas sp.]
MGGFIADLFIETILDGLVWGTGALVLKVLRPGRPVGYVPAVLLGLIVWLAAIAALLTIGYLLLV